jgi:hypothetical protein
VNLDYWKKQTDQPLFADIEWSRPQQKSRLGKLLIVGGTAHGFAAVVKSYSASVAVGVGEVKVAVPDALKQNLPADFSQAILLPTNQSGAISLEAKDQLLAAASWADGVLLIGDSGMNSETEVLLNNLLASTSSWVTVSRDAIDLLCTEASALANRPQTNLLMNFNQTQKLFSSLYYPKILTFSMQLTNFVEALHKFTITYPLTLTVVFGGKIIVAYSGQVASQDFADQTALINGQLAAKAAAYLLWNPQKPLEAVATSWLT